MRNRASDWGIPQSIAFKPSNPQLYLGHKARHDKLDGVERMLSDEKLSAQVVADKARVDLEIVKDVLQRYRASAHKRSNAPKIRVIQEPTKCSETMAF